jgi:hypothetical protein
MSLYDQIIEALPELAELLSSKDETIILQNDSDGLGDYVAKWEYSKPIPVGLKLGK